MTNFQLVLYFLLLITSSVQLITPSDHYSRQGTAHSCKYAWLGGPTPSLGTDILFPEQPQDLYNVWDPGIIPPPAPALPRRGTSSDCSRYETMSDLSGSIGITGAAAFPWMDKLAHITSWDRGGKGIKCIYWNKGPSFLTNKQLDIDSIISTHKPHMLGLGEANFRHDHDLRRCST